MIACFSNVFIKQGLGLGPQLLKSEKQSSEAKTNSFKYKCKHNEYKDFIVNSVAMAFH